MMGYVEAPRAWWRVNGMARKVGVSLPGAVTDGFLTRRELITLVERCQCCADAAPCTRWLEAGEAEATCPQGCGNRAELDALRPDL